MFLWGMAVGIVFLTAVLLAGLKGLVTARDLEQESWVLEHDRSEGELGAMELAERIFSPRDWTLVQELKNAELSELFRRERKSVALLWVRHTSVAIRQVMREHAEAARASRNFEVWTELKLIGQYVELRLICGILYASIQIGGPLWLRGWAIHAEELSRRIAEAQASLQAATSAGVSSEA
jgi:hypothetical protein